MATESRCKIFWWGLEDGTVPTGFRLLGKQSLPCPEEELCFHLVSAHVLFSHAVLRGGPESPLPYCLEVLPWVWVPWKGQSILGKRIPQAFKIVQLKIKDFCVSNMLLPKLKLLYLYQYSRLVKMKKYRHPQTKSDKRKALQSDTNWSERSLGSPSLLNCVLWNLFYSVNDLILVQEPKHIEH